LVGVGEVGERGAVEVWIAWRGVLVARPGGARVCWRQAARAERGL
jgi:hypothetical protein